MIHFVNANQCDVLPRWPRLLMVVKHLSRIMVISLIGLRVPTSGWAQEHLTSAVANDWSARTEKIRSLKVRWTSTTTFFEGGLNSQALMIASQKNQLKEKIFAGANVPSEDVQVKTRHQILMIGESVRYDFETIRWSQDAVPAPFVKPRKAMCIDGKAKSFDPLGLGEGTTPTGIALDDRIRDLFEPASLPLLVHCRPDSPTYGRYSLKRFAKTEAKIDGDSLSISAATKGRDRVFIQCSPQHEHSVASFVLFDPLGNRVLSFQIIYDDDSTIGQFPRQWTTIQYDTGRPGKLIQKVTAEVESYEVNTLADSEDLKFEFEKGTIVFGGEDTGRYIVGADGRAIRLTNADMSRPYEELRAMTEGNPRRRSWLVVCGVVLVVIGVAASIWIVSRRRKAKRLSAMSSRAV